jgi:hypothetical protein
MMMRLPKNSCAFYAVLMVSLSFLVGCAQRTKIREAGRDLVSGTVTLDGKPLSAGTITFISVKDSIYTTTAAIRDGHFQVSNAPSGECRVTVETESTRAIPQGYVAIPLKYNNAATSGLTATILTGQPEGTKLTIELKSK